jgi:hypothetical protein
MYGYEDNLFQRYAKRNEKITLNAIISDVGQFEQ